MNNLKRNFTNDKDSVVHTLKPIIDSEKACKIIADNYYQNFMQNIENSDVNINHLENIFTDETYYLAMKIVPLIERKVLYLSYVENVKLNDICKRLKLSKNEVIRLRNKAIIHFKNNLATILKANKLKKGGVVNAKF